MPANPACLTGKPDWQTPPDIADMARDALGGRIDLDPCSTAQANLTIKAARFFTPETNGLDQEWNAGSVYMNPPYTRGVVRQWTRQLIAECRRCKTLDWENNSRGRQPLGVSQAVTLVNASTDTQWFLELVMESAGLVGFSIGRIKFVDPRTQEIADGAQPCGQAVFGLGNIDPERFYRAFYTRFWFPRRVLPNVSCSYHPAIR